MTGFSISKTRLLLGAAAGLLFLGSALFAATAPGGARPRVSDLPVISLTRDVNEAASPGAEETATASVDPTATPAVTATSTTGDSNTPATKPSPTPGTSDGDGDDDREVVSPPVRDEADEPSDDDREVVSPPVRDHDDIESNTVDESRLEDGESSQHKDSPDEE